MPIMSDPLEKTVRVPVRIRGGRLEFFYGSHWGQEMPPIKNGTLAELILPEFAINDQKWLMLLQEEQIVPLLPEGTKLLVEVHPSDQTPTEYRALFEAVEHRIDQMFMPTKVPNWRATVSKGFIPITLMEALHLRLRGTKPAELEEVRCQLPGPFGEADSLNHAYNVISEYMEPHRRGHGGNVFRMVHFFDPMQQAWLTLDALRQKFQMEWERKIMAVE